MMYFLFEFKDVKISCKTKIQQVHIKKHSLKKFLLLFRKNKRNYLALSLQSIILLSSFNCFWIFTNKVARGQSQAR